jgi:hypothetical protein
MNHQEWAAQRHTYWYRRIRDWCHDAGVTGLPDEPGIEFRLEAFNWCGRYSRRFKRCIYPLPYVIMLGESYDDTIAHEMVHHFQWAVMPKSAKHGETFHMLMKYACGFDGKQTYHAYDVKKAKQISSMLILTKNLAATRT